MSLSTKAVALLAVLVFAVLAVASLFLLHYQEESLKRSILDGLDGQARGAANGIAAFVEQGIQESKAASITLPVDALRHGRLVEVESHLRKMFETFPAFQNGIFVLDQNGKFLIDYPSHPDLRGQSFAFREYYQRTMQEQRGIVSEPYRSKRTGEPVVTFTAPVRDSQGHIFAVLACSVNLLAPEALGSYLQEKFEKTGYLYVFDKSRRLILHPERDRLMTVVETGTNRIMEAALHGYEGGGETVNSKGVPMLLAVRKIPKTSLMVAVQVTQHEGYAPITKARSRILYISGIAILLVIVVGAVAIRGVSRPLQQLERVATQITMDLETTGTGGANDLIQADLTGLTRLRSRDEVGRLAASFLRLATKLSSTVSYLRFTNEQLLEAKKAAEAANRAKSEFLANMSHEIRTPMNGIMGMTELLLEDEHTAEQHEYLDMVKLSADSLLKVINDILDFSKIESGKLDLEGTDFNLTECVESTLQSLTLQADEKNLKLLCDIAPEVPDVVRGDAGRLRQVITNLVNNAIKFTQRGEVSLRLELEAQRGNTQVLHFTVTDTGIGIPPEKQKAIFDPFTQADASTTRKYGGTGLGLTISSRLVSAMGGSIWVESTVGRGTQFHFTVQTESSVAGEILCGVKSPAAAISRAALGGSVPSRSLRVLLAEDNVVNQRLASSLLKNWGYQVDAAGTGCAVLAALEKERYDVVLMDVQMPDMDGMEATAAIREKERTTGGHRSGRSNNNNNNNNNNNISSHHSSSSIVTIASRGRW